MTHANEALSAGFDLWRPISHWLKTAAEQRSRRQACLRTLRELDSMTDRELADINISRLSLREIAAQVVDGR